MNIPILFFPHNINEEYRKIFGESTRPTLYAADDEEYNSLRQQIVDAPRDYSINKRVLPFTGVKLLSYKEYIHSLAIQEIEAQGFHVFYIRRYRGNELNIYAAAYFDYKKKNFCVLQSSFFPASAYYKKMLDCMPLYKSEYYRIKTHQRKGVVTIDALLTKPSASLAASLVLGEKVSFKEWKDERGKTLDAYYAHYKAADIEKKEDRTFPDYIDTSVVPTPEPKPVTRIRPQAILPESDRTIQNIFAGLKSFVESGEAKAEKEKKKDKVSEYQNLIFYIHEESLSASGYYNPETKYFYIRKGSTVALKEDAKYAGTESSEARKRFLGRACAISDNCYTVIKDAMCRSAEAAAAYVLGRNTTFAAWKDKDGNTLRHYHPSHFKRQRAGIVYLNAVTKQLGITTKDAINYLHEVGDPLEDESLFSKLSIQQYELLTTKYKK